MVGGAAATVLPAFVRDPNAMTGISVLGLLIVAIGAMHGLLPQLLRHPASSPWHCSPRSPSMQVQQLVGALIFRVTVRRCETSAS